MKKILFLLLTIVIFSCTEEKKYQYGIDPIDVTQGGGQKTNQKSTTEFISIAYSDLYGTVIPQTKLVNLSVAYSSFGDLKVIEKRIIANFLNDTTLLTPIKNSSTVSQMNSKNSNGRNSCVQITLLPL